MLFPLLILNSQSIRHGSRTPCILRCGSYRINQHPLFYIIQLVLCTIRDKVVIARSVCIEFSGSFGWDTGVDESDWDFGVV